MLSTTIVDMPDSSSTTLAEYLQSLLDERQLSIRAFATYAGIAHSTVRRILAGETVDYQTLQAIAGYLNIPVESVYRMAGLLPAEEPLVTAMLEELEHLMRQLPEESQRKLLEMARIEFKYSKRGDSQRKAG